MTAEVNQTADEVQIRKIVDDWVQAVRLKDSAALAANLAPDVVIFDLITPLWSRGADAVQKRAEEWLSSFEGPLDYDVRDLQVTAGPDVGFCHSLNHVHGTTTDGRLIDMWWRATVCLRKTAGKWLVLHEHSSVPFDMHSGKASMDSRP